MGKITLIIILFLFISCDKNSNFTRDNNDKKSGLYVKSNTFINSSGLYYFRDVDIVVKEFKDGTIIYGLFDLHSKLLYQRNINASINNHMKWTIYIDSQGQIWFYNADYQETNVFIPQGEKGSFIKDKSKLPPIPVELTNFIKNK